MSDMNALQAAAQRKSGSKRKFNSKYKSKIFKGSKGKSKPDDEGKLRPAVMPKGWENDPKYQNPSKPIKGKKPVRVHTGANRVPIGYEEWNKRKDEANSQGRSYIDGWRSENNTFRPIKGVKKKAPVKRVKPGYKHPAVPTTPNTNALTEAVKEQAG